MQRQLKDDISDSWQEKRESVNMSIYTYEDFKQFLLDKIALKGNHKSFTMRGKLLVRRESHSE